MPKVFNFRPRSNLFRRAIDLPQKAPSSFVIFNAGDNPGDDGPAIFDKQAAELVMSEFKKRGVLRLTIDYDHASIDKNTRPQDRVAAGWFTPGLDNGDCRAGNVNWSDAAKNGIERKEWLYISPVFTKDENGRITSLVNLAITNNPATWGARPLIAASRGFSMDPNLAMLYACLLAVAGGAEPFASMAQKDADEMLSMAGDGASAIQEAAKQYMTSEPVAASVTPDAGALPDNKQVAASTTTDDQTKVVAASTQCTPDEQAARSLNAESAALLARSMMVSNTVDDAANRAALIAKLQSDKLLPKAGPPVEFARSCDVAEFTKFETNLRANNATIRTAGAKIPVGGLTVTKTNVNTEIDKVVLRTAVQQSGIDPKKIQDRILRNREKAAEKTK
jgi:phage I-like protein